MSNLLSKINAIVNTASTVNNIASTVKQINQSGLLNGVDFKNINVNNIGQIGNTVKSNIERQAAELTGVATGSTSNVSEIEKLANSITPEDLGIDKKAIAQEFTNIPGFDPSMLDGIMFK